MSQDSDCYDVIVIGAGPAGYIAAIRCAQLGFSTVCIDSWKGKNGKHSLGGACINAGCIASKALLDSSDLYHSIQHGLTSQGIKITGVELDLSIMIKHKDKVISRLAQNITSLFKTNNIKTIHGVGKLLDGKRVEIIPVNGSGAPKVISAENIVLAAGSSPMEISTAPIDGEFIVGSTDALNFESVPNKLGIIGAGIVGSELGSIWRRLGSEVILLEAQEEFLTIADKQIAQEAYRQYKAQGLEIRLGCRMTGSNKTTKHVIVQYEDKHGKHRLQLDKLIVAIGRKPNSDQLFAPETNLLLDERGFVHTDEQCMTNLPGVYAIGDLCQGPMLAHKGMEEALFVAEAIAGKESKMDYDVIPSVIYTEPEMAWVGQTEQALRAAGEDINIGVFPFDANSRALAMGKESGLVKIIASAQTDKILGVHIIGNSASELIAEAVLAMEFSASSEDLARTIHAHPTLAESLREAALAVDYRSLHSAN